MIAGFDLFGTPALKPRIATSLFFRLGFRILLLAFSISCRAGHPEFSPLPEIPPAADSLWQPFLTVRAAAGYRSNPLLAHDP